MAKYFQNPFAVGGDRVTVPEAVQPSGEVSWIEGFGVDYQLDPDTDPDALNIPRDKFNEIIYEVTLALKQYQELGFPDFITSADNGGVPFEYAINATVRFEDGWAGAGFKNYYSLVSSNDTDPTDATKWGIVTYAEPVLTGTVLEYWNINLPDGYVWPNGQTIGNAASGATGRANADTQALFTQLWNATTQAAFPLQDSSGAVVARGLSAAVDFAANRRFPLPDRRENVGVGLGDMGGSTDPLRISVAGVNISGVVLGATGGAQTISLTATQNGQHTHSASTGSSGTHTHKNGIPGTNVGFNPYVYGSTVLDLPGMADIRFSQGGGLINFQGFTSTDGAHTHTVTVSDSGTGAAHGNVQPTIVCNFIMKL